MRDEPLPIAEVIARHEAKRTAAVEARSPGGRAPVTRMKRSERTLQVEREIQAGDKYEVIGNRHGITKQRVQHIARRMGVRRNRPVNAEPGIGVGR
jgi:hypothetical protein